MDQHLTAEQVQLIADGELEIAEHVEHCGRCATAILGAKHLKSVVRDAMRTEAAPAALRRSLTGSNSAPWWMAAAAAVLSILLAGGFVVRERSRNAAAELADMHVTLIGGANPIDVISTDRHTVKPWFEGRVPFAVPIPDLSSTEFRLIGGRVVFWRGNPGAYLLVRKGAHKISVFVFPDENAPQIASTSFRTLSTLAWREGGVSVVAVADIPSADLQALRAAFGRP